MRYENKQIKDICEFIGGSQPPKGEFIHEAKEGYVRLIQIRDRLNDKFITYIPEKSTTKFCEPDDILIGRYGPPIFQIFRGFKGAYNVAIMKANPLNGVDKDYLYYFLLQNSILKYVESMSARTAGQTGVELDSLYEYPVLLPDIEGQRKIAGLLKCIDDKISNNNAINDELEAMAKTIYDYWFLQFEFPDENGKPYKSSGGKMVWNEELQRDIPEDWKVSKISSLLAFEKGKIPQSLSDNQESENSSPYLTIAVANGDSPQYCERKDMPFCNGSTIMVMDGAASGDVYIGNVGILGSTFAMLISKREDISDSLIYRIMSANQEFYKKANTGSTVPHANRKYIESMKLCLPSDLSTYSQTFDKIQNAIIHNKKENRELASLRDFLLPLLMNGQVTFKTEE